MGTTLSEIAKTKIVPTHRTLFVDKSTSALEQLKDMLSLFQPEPISSLPIIANHTPLAEATSTIQQNPLLKQKPILKDPVREQRVFTTPEQRVFVTPPKKVNFPIPNTPTLPIVPPPLRDRHRYPEVATPQYISSPQYLWFPLPLRSRQLPPLHQIAQSCLLLPLLLPLPLLLAHPPGPLLHQLCQHRVFVATPRRALARSRLAVVCPSVHLSEHTQSCPSVQALRARSWLSVWTKLTDAHTL